mgnify:FL=1
MRGSAVLLLAVWSLGTISVQASVSLQEFLKRKEVREVKTLDGVEQFDEVLEILLEQPLDHRNPEGPTFSQRLYISHVDPELPVVLITAGYDTRYYYT